MAQNNKTDKRTTVNNNKFLLVPSIYLLWLTVICVSIINTLKYSTDDYSDMDFIGYYTRALLRHVNNVAQRLLILTEGFLVFIPSKQAPGECLSHINV